MATLTLGNALLSAFAGTKLQKHKARNSAPHPTAARILRNSVEAGTFEHVFFVPPAKGETDRLLRAARRILDAGKQLRSEARRDARPLTSRERLLTTLTSASVRVLEEILTLARLNKGQVFPSYDYLAQATSLGRATVARSLRILESIGFLVRQRRFKRVENVEGPGPRLKQTSNAYRTVLPRIILDYLPRWMRPAPTPDDELHRQAERAEELEHMRSQLSCQELAETSVDGALGKVLARLGAALDRQERESQTDTQTQLNSIIITESQPTCPEPPTWNISRRS
ncbi:helix-turn-helix domain-containing protein [Novosphingobium sp. P6W]|uniref:helix-turn-helix domain-containing protein n=1 Tax=Novosphingobium sp. P6W TaxID=1609758 RepID=UPI0009E3F3E1|nr:helix-turn-helix domain-containing protein [Novosphingobium sp. P6W]AXB80638.1 helix-turn-helix domain-containing protein [Novosphingobium sp. P6W]